MLFWREKNYHHRTIGDLINQSNYTQSVCFKVLCTKFRTEFQGFQFQTIVTFLLPEVTTTLLKEVVRTFSASKRKFPTHANCLNNIFPDLHKVENLVQTADKS